MKNESWFDACLAPGETVQWTGRPAMHFPHAHTDGVAALSVLALFVMVWGLTKMPLADYPPAVVTLTFMVVMAVIPAAAWLAGSAFLRRPWLIRHTEYVVTDRRILRRRGRTVDSMCFLSMPEPRLERHENGRGSIRFASACTPVGPENTLRATEQSRLHFRLDHIEDADRVITLIRQLRAQQPTPSLPPETLAMTLLPVERDEHVLWQGKPRLRFCDVLPANYLVAGLVLTILALLSREIAQLNADAGKTLWFLPELFLQVGTFLLIERTIRMAWRCAHAAFIVTDRRVLYKWGRETGSFPLSACPNVFLAEDRGHVGTVVLSTELGGTTRSLLLCGLTDAIRVQDVIAAAIRVHQSA